MSTESPQTVTGSVPAMRPAQVIQAISGLMAAMFVVLVSSTVVATPMPRIMADLNGTNTEYTWVLVAAFLSMTVSTPIWGKLADIFNRKLLLQLALAIFTIATVAAGFASQIGGDSHEGAAQWLIGWRFVQSIGTGGLMALGQVVIADIISPRERGKYMGLMGAVMAVGQIGGPLLGGVIADGWGWEWCFFVCVPIAVVAFAMIQATLHVSNVRRKIRIDFLGAALIVAGISILLIWISLGGKTEDTGGFAWDSANSYIMLGVGGALTIAAVITELLVKEPIIPIRLFAQRTFALASVASIAVGVTMFGTSVFLSQYLQYARGLTPTDSGLATIPMVIGSMAGAVGVGQAITRTGRWKPFVIGGSVVLTVGLALMSQIHYDTDMWSVWLNMFLLGLGSGVLMQNLVLVTQNSLPATQLGAGSGAVTFFRSLGGTVGVSVLGSVLGTQVGDRIKDGLTDLLAKIDPTMQAPQVLVDHPDCADSLQSMDGGAVPDVAALCEPVRTVVESGYGDSIAFLFLLVVPLAIVTFLCVCFLPNKPLSRKTAAQQIEEELGAELSALEPAERGGEGFRELVETGQITLPDADDHARARRRAAQTRAEQRRAQHSVTDDARTAVATAERTPEVADVVADPFDELGDLAVAGPDVRWDAERAREAVARLQAGVERARAAFDEVERHAQDAALTLAAYDRSLRDALRAQEAHARWTLDEARERHEAAQRALAELAPEQDARVDDATSRAPREG